MMPKERAFVHPRRLVLAVVAALLLALLCLPLVIGAQAPAVDCGQPPPQWAESGYGYWARSEEYVSTGRDGYISKLTSGEMVDYQGGETVLTGADLVVGSSSDQVLAGFGARMTDNYQCEPLDDGQPVIPQFEVFEGQFLGYPATVVEATCRHPSYAYADVTCDTDGNCAPDTDSGVAEYWEGGSTGLARLTCIEIVPGGPCTVVIEEIFASTEGPAALGENPEQASFEALVAEVDAWKATWIITAPGPTEAPLPSPTPEQAVTIQGIITALDPASALSHVPGANKLVLPLIEVPVELKRGAKLLARTFSQLPDGRFEFTVPITDGLVISATLQHAASAPPAFQVVYDQGPDPIWIATRPFDLGQDTPDILDKNISLSDPGDLTSRPTTIPPDRLDDVGLIFHYAREAWQMAAILLGQTLDQPTLDLRAFSSTPGAAGSAYWEGPPAGAGPAPVLIEISPKYSDFGRAAAPDTVMHEFGHHVMADAYDNAIPYAAGDTFHAGFSNPTTSDSWVEGFATFYALWTKSEQIQAPSPHLWHNYGEVYNLELNYLAWSTAEEFAVAALLWDLFDPVDPADSIGMPVVGYASQPVITATTTTYYADHVQLDRAELWRLLSDGALASPDRPPDAPQGYPYIYDVQQLYDTLTLNGVGLILPATPNGLDAVDELFIAHGFFADTNPQNLAWDPGEAIGVTDNKAITVGTDQFAARVARRSPPPVEDTYISYDAQDAATGAAADVVDFLVTVEFEPPYEGYNYHYYTRARPDGQIAYSGPPPYYQATTSIEAAGPGVSAGQPLVFTNTEYWQMRDQQPSGPLMEHTFDVQMPEASDSGDSGSGESGSTEPLDGTGSSDEFEGGAPAVVPSASDDLLLPLIGCGGLGILVVLGAVVVIGARSRKKRKDPPPVASRAPAPRPAPVQAPQKAAPAVSCTRCGRAARPGTKFCSACGGPVAAASPQPVPGATGWQLLIVDGPGAGHRYALGARTSLGRKDDNGIPLNDRLASRYHAEFQQAGDGYLLQDLGSRNGTWLNGQRVGQAVAVNPGDRVQIGSTLLQVTGPGSPVAPSGLLVCAQCGQRVNPGTKFCRHCGGRVAG